jgi:uncharacterized protein YjbI with pentapeptide repeats
LSFIIRADRNEEIKRQISMAMDKYFLPCYELGFCLPNKDVNPRKQIRLLFHSFWNIYIRLPFTYLANQNRIPKTDIFRVTFNSRKMSHFVYIELLSQDFSGLDLEQATFKHVFLQGTSFLGTNLRESKFNNIIFGPGVNFVRATLRDTIFSNVSKDNQSPHLSFQQAELHRSEFINVQTPKSDFSYAVMSFMKLESVNLENSNCIHTNFYRTQFLSNVKLRGVDFSFSDLSFCFINDCDLTNAKLCHANLIESTIRDCNLTGIDLSFADLSSVGGLTVELLKTVKTLYGCQGLKQDLETILLREAPHLFEKP